MNGRVHRPVKKLRREGLGRCACIAAVHALALGCRTADIDTAPLADAIALRDVGAEPVASAPPDALRVAPEARVEGNVECSKLCAPARRLGCKLADECGAHCAAMAATTKCRSELQQFFSCLIAEPVEHWECMEDGTGAIKQGYCEPQQARFATCVDSTQ